MEKLESKDNLGKCSLAVRMVSGCCIDRDILASYAYLGLNGKKRFFKRVHDFLGNFFLVLFCVSLAQQIRYASMTGGIFLSVFRSFHLLLSLRNHWLELSDLPCRNGGVYRQNLNYPLTHYLEL